MMLLIFFENITNLKLIPVVASRKVVDYVCVTPDTRNISQDTINVLIEIARNGYKSNKR